MNSLKLDMPAVKNVIEDITSSQYRYNENKRRVNYFIELISLPIIETKTLIEKIKVKLNEEPIISETQSDQYNDETLLICIAKINKDHLSKNLANDILNISNDSINIADKDGNTALMHAAISNNLVILPVLTKNNTDSSIKNKNGETAFILSAKRNHRDFLEQMYNLNLEVTENDEKEALLIFSEKHHIDTATLLLEKSQNQDNLLLFLNEKKCTEILDDHISNIVEKEGDNPTSLIYDEHGHANVLLFAALYGNIGILKKISEFNYKINATAKNQGN